MNSTTDDMPSRVSENYKYFHKLPIPFQFMIKRKEEGWTLRTRGVVDFLTYKDSEYLLCITFSLQEETATHVSIKCAKESNWYSPLEDIGKSAIYNNFIKWSDERFILEEIRGRFPPEYMMFMKTLKELYDKESSSHK